MLYYQLDATFHFDPYKNHGELMTEPQDKDIERINRRLQRAFSSIDATPFPSFVPAALQNMTKLRLSSA